MTDHRHYRCGPPSTVLTVPLDELTALFHRPSGQTHIVDPVDVAILAVLRPGGDPVAAIMARLASDFDVSGDRAALTARLDGLAMLGLAETA